MVCHFGKFDCMTSVTPTPPYIEPGPSSEHDVPMTIEEVAEFLKLGKQSVYRHVNDGLIPAKRVCHQWRIYKRTLLAWLAKANNQPSYPVPSEKATARILIIDDDAGVLEVIKGDAKKLFRDAQVEATSDPLIGLTYVGTMKPHILLLDHLMEPISGLTICQSLKRDANTTRIHIVAMSAYFDDKGQLEAQFKDANADQILKKPFKKEALKRKIEFALDALPSMA